MWEGPEVRLGGQDKQPWVNGLLKVLTSDHCMLKFGV